MTAKMVESKNAQPSHATLDHGSHSSAPSDPPAKNRSMPDVAKSSTASHSTTLDWVGMGNIALPITLCHSNNLANSDNASGAKPSLSTVGAQVTVHVNLNNPDVRGIHMSRLYLLLTQYAENELLSAQTLRQFMKQLLQSHEDISDSVFLKFSFEQLIKQPALLSQNSGWKSYPVTISATLEEGIITQELSVTVPYSSTCPCSAALARQLLQEHFTESFADKSTVTTDEVANWLRSENGTFATPHSQRSLAQVRVKLEDTLEVFPIQALVEKIESTLKTPVQTAVKREDEQEFARLNGQNLMFCEDSARRLKNSLNVESQFQDFWVKVNHLESLHAHDAVAVATKGIKGGYASNPELF